jgi:hypothetical protein
MPPEALAQIVQGVDDPGAFADMVAFYLEMPAKEKQRCWSCSRWASGCGACWWASSGT